jgi:hypothetical protein
MMADSGRLCSGNRAFQASEHSWEADRYSDCSLECHIIRTEVRQIISKTTPLARSSQYFAVCQILTVLRIPFSIRSSSFLRRAPYRAEPAAHAAAGGCDGMANGLIVDFTRLGG